MEYTVTWLINNYSYCYHKNGESLDSPEFFCKGLENTSWCLLLFPRGNNEERKGYISFFLKRSAIDDGPENILLNYELSCLGSDGIALRLEKIQYTFDKGISYGYSGFLKKNKVFLEREDDYLPQDTMTLQCKIWTKKGDIKKVEHISIRTLIEIEHISFLHVVDGFSTIEPNQNNTMEIELSKEKECMTSNVCLSNSSCCDGKIIVEFTPSSTKQNISKCEIFLLPASAIILKCGEDNRYDDSRKDISKLTLFLRKKDILEKKSEYLPDDKLSLLCICSFSTGEVYQKVERIVHEMPSVVLSQINRDDHQEEKYKFAGHISACPSVVDDLKELYNTQLLTDVVLKTETKSFRAHKNILCARSPVFKSMLTTDMKEKNTDCIQMDDLEIDTVEKFLNFLYTDSLENISWEPAIKLYYAADKYGVEKLKVMCSSILLENLSTTTAIELLLLADTHNDSKLHKSVNDFILKHDAEVFGSDEWGNLIETNPTLVSKTMRLKYLQND